MLVTLSDISPFLPPGYLTDGNYDRFRYISCGVESFIRHYTNNDFIDRATGEVCYPPDVKLGAINLIRWELTARDKTGIASETISRHSVSYSNDTEQAAGNGYPGSLLGFLKPYMRARF